MGADADANDEASGQICRPGGSGMVLPLIPGEQEWPSGLRAVLYGAGMIYFFVGVAIIADTFVASIEVVASRRRRVTLKTGRIVTRKVWNETVATLSLMALGSSAPEIALSVIDLFKKRYFFTPLGAQTIVGSAAFNLLIIVAVCVTVIPAGESRAIRELPAFYVTAAVSLFAYLWLVFILIVCTPDVVDMWEAVATFMFLPALIWVSYIVDVRNIGKAYCQQQSPACSPPPPKDEEATTAALEAPEKTAEPPMEVQQHKGNGSGNGERAHEKAGKGSTHGNGHGNGNGNGTAPTACISDGPVEMQEAEDSGKPSYLGFTMEHFSVAGMDKPQILEVTVTRSSAIGQASCLFRTERFSAVPGFDYAEAEGIIEFNHGEAVQQVEVELLPRAVHKVAREFFLILEEVQGTCEFDPKTDGGADSCILTVTIAASSARDPSSPLGLLDTAININGIHRGNADWVEQLISSVYCNGSPEEQQEATKTDWATHFMALPWKLLFALVPPTSYFGGWVCFYGSLAVIGVLTVFVSDLAELLGCVVGMDDDVTAIVFVALGTSMPDLFASLTAAKEEPSADASIVNVTGSNSVNVFLGLGLPWTIGSVYWAFVGKTPSWSRRYPHLAAQMDRAAFVVESRNLGFCVFAFSAACMLALILIHCRRKMLGAELGGPSVPKIATGLAFCLLWCSFIAVSSWRVMRWHQADVAEQVGVILATGSVAAIGWVIAMVIVFAFRVPKPVAVLEEVTQVPAASWSGRDHRKSKLDRTSNIKDRNSESSSGMRGSAQTRSSAHRSSAGSTYDLTDRSLKKGSSSESWNSGFSVRNGIAVSV